MQIEGSRFLSSPRERVWTLINQNDILQQCIPGCQSIEEQTDGTAKVVVLASVGPVRARFVCTLEKLVLVEGRSFRITGQGSGGLAGHGKTTVQMDLVEADGGAQLSYTSESSVGGKLAQVGSRLVQAAAEKFIRDFFSSFESILAAPTSAVVEDNAATPKEQATPAAPRPSSMDSRGRSLLARFFERLSGIARFRQGPGGSSTLEAHVGIADLVSRYGVMLDRKDFHGVCQLFAANATLSIGGNKACGHSEILELLRSRPANPSLHLVSAPMIELISSIEARATSSVAVFRQSAPSEVAAAGSAGTKAVAVYRDTFRRHPEGWLFESREAEAFMTL